MIVLIQMWNNEVYCYCQSLSLFWFWYFQKNNLFCLSLSTKGKSFHTTENSPTFVRPRSPQSFLKQSSHILVKASSVSRTSAKNTFANSNSFCSVFVTEVQLSVLLASYSETIKFSRFLRSFLSSMQEKSNSWVDWQLSRLLSETVHKSVQFWLLLTLKIKMNKPENVLEELFLST